MDFLLICTTDFKRLRRDVLDRMVGSVAAAAGARPEDRFVLEFVPVNCTKAEADAAFADLPPFVRVTPVVERLSLSAGRNVALRRAITENEVPRDGIVAFPDDDCWYPDGLLTGLAALFRMHAELDFWFCRYLSAPREAPDLARLPVHPAKAGDVVRFASSTTMFFRGRAVLAAGLFDETLGLGTKIASGEDTQYVLRVLQVARLIVFRNEPLVGHRDPSPAHVAQYYPGALLALAQTLTMRTSIAFGRKILVGVYLVLVGRMGFGKFVAALRLVATNGFATRSWAGKNGL